MRATFVSPTVANEAPVAVTVGAVLATVTIVKLIVVEARPNWSDTVRRRKVLPAAAGAVMTGLASAEVAVEPPKMQFDEQLVLPPEEVTWRQAYVNWVVPSGSVVEALLAGFWVPSSSIC